jgi:hypothetical protein
MTTAEMARTMIIAKRAGDTQDSSNCTYEQWIATVDVLLSGKTGVGHADHVDHLWLDVYEGGDTPADAVADFLEDEGFDDDDGEFTAWIDEEEGDDFDADDADADYDDDYDDYEW